MRVISDFYPIFLLFFLFLSGPSSSYISFHTGRRNPIFEGWSKAIITWHNHYNSIRMTEEPFLWPHWGGRREIKSHGFWIKPRFTHQRFLPRFFTLPFPSSLFIASFLSPQEMKKDYITTNQMMMVRTEQKLRNEELFYTNSLFLRVIGHQKRKIIIRHDHHRVYPFLGSNDGHSSKIKVQFGHIPLWFQWMEGWNQSDCEKGSESNRIEGGIWNRKDMKSENEEK